MTARPTLDQLAGELACRLASEGRSSDDDRAQARALLEEIGVGRLVQDLEMAERIIKAGEGFHSVERFFVDGSDEQRFIFELKRRG